MQIRGTIYSAKYWHFRFYRYSWSHPLTPTMVQDNDKVTNKRSMTSCVTWTGASCREIPCEWSAAVYRRLSVWHWTSVGTQLGCETRQRLLTWRSQLTDCAQQTYALRLISVILNTCTTHRYSWCRYNVILLFYSSLFFIYICFVFGYVY